MSSNLRPDQLDILPVQLAKMLERDIVVGRLAPDQRLTEDAVLARVDVSRSPIREAFRLLEQDGLVVRGLRRGVRVTPMSVEDLDEVYEVRVPLEGLVAAAAARRAVATDIARLRDVAAKLAGDEVMAQPEAYLDANLAFSQALYATARNATLTRLAMGLAKQTLRYRFLAYDKVPEFRLESAAAARSLCEAIETHNAERAKALQADLLMSSWAKIKNALADMNWTEISKKSA
jgi:GntR family transcriptional regulator, rspAB operon transcriptional repressor